MDAIWTTRDGTKIPVRDMTDSHLLNTIRMLRRYGRRILSVKTARLLSCPYPSGEYASYAFDEELDGLMEAGVDDVLPSIYDALLEEAAQRALSTDSHV